MGKSSASDVLEHFNQGCSKLKKEKVILVALDGSNVNLKCLDLVNEYRSDDELSGLISIGTCDLHTFHRPFQHGAKIRSVGKVDQAIWKILGNCLHGVLIMRNLKIPQFALFNSINTDD